MGDSKVKTEYECDSKIGPSSIEKALDILSCFNEQKRFLKFRDFQQQLPYKKGTLHRLLSILKKRRIIIHDPYDRRYFLGPAIIEMAWNILSREGELRSRALECMQRLRDITNETVGLYIPLGNQRICIEEIESLHGLKYNAKIGFSSPLYVGASGKVLLAFMEEVELNEILQNTKLVSYTPNTITCEKTLRKELNQIQNLGYSVSNGERTLGVVAISAPIFDRRGRIKSAISIIGPEERLKNTKMESIAVHLIKSAKELSETYF